MKKIIVLDTNVLMYEPKSLFVFDDNEIVIPLVVLDELDKHKDGPSQTAKHARMVIRSLDELRALGNLSEGVVTERGGKIRVELNHRDHIPKDLDPTRADNRIISVALGLRAEHGDNTKVIVVTKDINLRVKCDALGVEAEDFISDAVVESLDFIYSGSVELQVSSQDIDKIHKEETLEVKNIIRPLYPNEYVLLRSDSNPKHSALARFDGTLLSKINSYGNIWGISPRNKEQAFAFDALFNPDIKLVTITGRAGCGKAQSLDSIVYTVYGPKKMKDITLGEKVCTPDGESAEVLGIYPQGEKDIYKIIFSDGTYTECCDEHLWYTYTQKDRDARRSGSTKELKEIVKTLRYGKAQKKNHSIPITQPVYFNTEQLPIDPYVLGVLLGDGCMVGGTPSFTTTDNEILASMSKYAEANELCLTPKQDKISFYISKKYINGKRQPSQNKNILTSHLKYIGLFGKISSNKYIPSIYKYTSVENRLSLLQGLMDTDGTVSKNGHISFTSVSKLLAEDVQFLVQSLGGTANIVERKTKYTYGGEIKDGKVSYRVNICAPNGIDLFTLERKLCRVNKRTKYHPRRYIDKIEYVGKKQAQCIYIDHPDHLYITDNFIVTHNTLLAAAAGVSQLIDSHIYKRIIMTRPIMPMGKDLGYLPGDKDEKMAPWMAPLYDNLELIFSDKGRYFMEDLASEGKLEVEPLTYIRGRSMPMSYIIVDEAQNLTRHEVKTMITRVGEGSKVVLTGDIEQIDTPYIDSVDNGLSCVVELFKDDPISAHIQLVKGERSELATKAAEKL